MARERWLTPEETPVHLEEIKAGKVYGYDVVECLNTDQDGERSILGQIVDAAGPESADRVVLQDVRRALRRGEATQRVYLGRPPGSTIQEMAFSYPAVDLLKNLMELVMLNQREGDHEELTENAKTTFLFYAGKVLGGKWLRFQLRKPSWPTQESWLQVPSLKNPPEYWESGRPKIESQNVPVTISDQPVLEKITLVGE